MRRSWTLAYAMTVLLAPIALGQDAPTDAVAGQSEGAGPAAEEELIQLTFPENLEVKVLIDYVSTRLGMNFLYDESKVRQRITIVSPTKIPKASLLGFLEGVLKMTGLAMVDADQPGWKQIVEGKELLAVSRGITEDREAVTAAVPTAVMTQQFELRHTTPAQVEQTIKPFLSRPGGNAFAIAERNVLFVTDYADVLRRIAPLVAMVDAARPEATLEFVPVKYWDSDELAKRVTSLLAEKDRVAGRPAGARAVTLTTEPRTNQIVIVSTDASGEEARALIEQLDVPSDLVTKTYRLRYVAPSRVDKMARDFAAAGELKERYRSTVDAESGLLIVRGSASVHEHIALLLRDLDMAEAGAEEGYVRFYKLLNATAMEVLSTIRSLEGSGAGLSAKSLGYLGGEGEATTPQKARQESFAGPNLPPSPVGEELPKPPVYREPEKKTESEGAATTSGGQGGTSSRQATVTATTRDAVVTADPNTNTLIVVAPPPVQRVYERLIKLLDKRRPQVMVEMILVTLDTTNNFSLGIELSKAGSVGDKGVYLTFSSFELSTADLVSGALTLAPGIGANAVLLDPDTVNVVLRALATSGRSEVLSAPKVLVNDNASATLASVAEAPFTSVNASDTVATTSFGGYASAGTNVSVTPHISEGDHLLLNYSLSLSSFGEGGAAGIPPPRQTNDISSEVTVRDGYTVVVGGLTRKDTSKTESKVPLFGDIPLLGHLFRSITDNKSETTLYVFIRPIILRDDRFEDLKYLSAGDRDLAGLPEDFPSSEPLVMR